jgi:hypothetical protein
MKNFKPFINLKKIKLIFKVEQFNKNNKTLKIYSHNIINKIKNKIIFHKNKLMKNNNNNNNYNNKIFLNKNKMKKILIKYL